MIKTFRTPTRLELAEHRVKEWRKRPKDLGNE